MVTRNKHDLIRERRLKKKLDRIVDEATPKAPREGLKRARCPICGEKYVINNYEDREIRLKRILGVAVCANCAYRAGTERLVRIYKLGKQLSKIGACDEPDIHQLIQKAKELFE